MSSSVCQGLQSCLDPRLVVAEPLVLRLKLAPPKSNPPRLVGPTAQKPMLAELESEVVSGHSPDTMTGWSFLDVITGSRKDPVFGGDPVGVYVHPVIMKRSNSMLLREKISLDMCTESLGSENGSIDMRSGDSDVTASSSSIASEVEVPMPRRTSMKRMSRSRSFPPPLTSIGGSTGVQMRPHREGGRLVLEAMAVFGPVSSFEVERSEGRLRLRLSLREDREDRNTDDKGTEEEAEAGEERKGDWGKLGKKGNCRPRLNNVIGLGLLRLDPFMVAI